MIMKFPERLRELRLSKGLTQKDMEKRFSLGLGVISKWEKGKNEPSFSMLVTLAEFFEVTADYILGIED